MVSSGPDQREGRDENGGHPGGSGLASIVLKVVLGLVALAGFALLGAGGGLLIKHLRTPSTEVPALSTVASAPSMAVLASAPAAVPIPVSVPAAIPAPAAVVTALSSAPSSAPAPAVALRADTQQPDDAPPAKTPARTRKPPRTATADDGAAPASADRAACLAKINTVNADLSLRNEPPTAAQLAILKRGCK